MPIQLLKEISLFPLWILSGRSGRRRRRNGSASSSRSARCCTTSGPNNRYRPPSSQAHRLPTGPLLPAPFTVLLPAPPSPCQAATALVSGDARSATLLTDMPDPVLQHIFLGGGLPTAEVRQHPPSFTSG